MTLQTQHTANAPATLTDEQRRRVADALENAQSENTRRNYAGQYRKFRAWCEREGQPALPAQPEVVAAYAAELAKTARACPWSGLRSRLSWIPTDAWAWTPHRLPESARPRGVCPELECGRAKRIKEQRFDQFHLGRNAIVEYLHYRRGSVRLNPALWDFTQARLHCTR